MVRKLSTQRKNGFFYDKYMVEEESDLKTIIRPNMGDVAYVIHTSEHWMCDSQQSWYSINDKTKGPIQCDCVEEMTIWDELDE